MELTKKQVCSINKAFAYYSGFGGVEIHHIEYGIEDYIYCVSNAWHGYKKYHKLKAYYSNAGGYIKLGGYKIPFDECLRIEEE